MKRIEILAAGVTVSLATESRSDILAFVPGGQSDMEVGLLATVARLPYFTASEALRSSPQAIRVVPTLRNIKRLGVGIYGTLPQEMVDAMNWREMRGVPTELLTAYLVARALRAERIRWCFLSSAKRPEVTTAVHACLLRSGVELCFKSCR